MEIEVIEVAGGNSAVLPSQKRIDRAQQRIESELAIFRAQLKSMEVGQGYPKSAMAEVVELKGRIATLERNASEIVSVQQSIRERCAGQIKVITIDCRPYTRGERLAAERHATEWKNGNPVFDQHAFDTCILASCLQKTAAEIDQMEPQIASYVVAELKELSEPDPVKLDFLSSAQHG